MVAMLCGWSQREQEEVIAFLREECGRTPASAPNCNAHAERLIRSIKTECLDRVVPLGERHLRHLVREFEDHYHTERNHQGIGNELIQPAARTDGLGVVRRRQRMGGMLNFYYRAAA